MPRVPPRKHLEKMRKRLERLEEMGLHECIRPEPGVRLPNRRARLDYMEVHDKLIGENLPDLLDDLLDMEE